jgi:hypothetical protein
MLLFIFLACVYNTFLYFVLEFVMEMVHVEIL